MHALYAPFIPATVRLRMIKILVVLGLISAMLMSLKLWLNTRMFPLVPVSLSIKPLPAPFDLVFLVSFMLLLVGVLLLRKPQKAIILLVLMSIGFIIQDQHRLQPWFFQYILMMFTLAFYNWRVDDQKMNMNVLKTVRIILAATYLWSGIHKMNAHFVHDVFPWLLEPLNSTCTPYQLKLILKFAYVFPLIEAMIGLMMLLNVGRTVFIPGAIMIHLGSLLLLGPLGHAHNSVVWPWNLMMIFLVYFSFAGSLNTKHESVKYLMQFKPIYVVGFATLVLPILHLFNKYDAYPSFNLYSGNTNTATIYLPKDEKVNLPRYIQYYTTNQDEYTCKIQLKDWAMQEMNVFGYPEERVYKDICNQFKVHLEDQSAMQMIYVKREGLALNK